MVVEVTLLVLHESHRGGEKWVRQDPKIWAHSDARTQHPDLFFCCMIGSPDRSDIAIHHDVGSDSSAS